MPKLPAAMQHTPTTAPVVERVLPSECPHSDHMLPDECSICKHGIPKPNHTQWVGLVEATYPGICAECGHAFSAGEMIGFINRNPVHEDCMP